MLLPEQVRWRFLDYLWTPSNWTTGSDGALSCAMDLNTILTSPAGAGMILAAVPPEFTATLDAQCRLHIKCAYEPVIFV